MITLFACAVAWARPPAEPLETLTVAQQSADLDQLRELIVELHPGLGVVADAAEVDAAFERARSNLVEGDTPLGFLRSAMLPVAAMRCSHTVIEPVGLQESELYTAGGWFPLDLWPDGERLWLDPRGVHDVIRELVAVNGRPVSEFLPELRARIEADGGRDSGQDVWIDREPWFAMTVLFGPRATWALTVRLPNGEVAELSVPGADPRQVRTESDLTPRGRSPARVAPGVIHVPWPQLADSERASRKSVVWLRELARDQQALVFDLRGNGGGRTLSLLDLVALFADHPFDPYRFGTTKLPWRDWPMGEDGRTHAPGAAGVYGGVAPLGDPPSVRLIVLVDERTASSASDLAFLLRREAGAIVVGRETGGGAWAQTAEQTVLRRLTHSGLAVQIPLVTIGMGPDELKGRGVIPDHEVRPTVEDLAYGRDPALACAIALARGLPCPVAPPALSPMPTDSAEGTPAPTQYDGGMWFHLLTALAADPWPRRACDMPDADLARTTVDSAEACEATCSARADCGGYTFVSGLNRCALEKPGAKAFELQMFAARIQVEDGRRSTTEPEPDHDHAGKDLETAPRDLPSPAACATACVDTASCVGFVYIQGYRSCWLKATDGALTPKRFVCAARPAPQASAPEP